MPKRINYDVQLSGILDAPQLLQRWPGIDEEELSQLVLRKKLLAYYKGKTLRNQAGDLIHFCAPSGYPHISKEKDQERCWDNVCFSIADIVTYEKAHPGCLFRPVHTDKPQMQAPTAKPLEGPTDSFDAYLQTVLTGGHINPANKLLLGERAAPAVEITYRPDLHQETIERFLTLDVLVQRWPGLTRRQIEESVKNYSLRVYERAKIFQRPDGTYFAKAYEYRPCSPWPFIISNFHIELINRDHYRGMEALALIIMSEQSPKQELIFKLEDVEAAEHENPMFACRQVDASEVPIAQVEATATFPVVKPVADATPSAMTHTVTMEAVAANWDKMTICFVNEQTIEIEVNGVKSNKTFDELAMFADKRTTPYRPNESWGLLFSFAKFNGNMSMEDIRKISDYKKKVSNLRQALSGCFPNMSGDPFYDVRGNRAYRTIFRIYSRIQSDSIPGNAEES